MDEDAGQSILARGTQQRVEVLLVGVDAAVGEQPEEMELTPAFLRPLHGLHQRRNQVKGVGGNQRVDAGDVHLHNAARADVQVAHFAVAHLAVGQPDKVVRRVNQRVGKLAEQLVVCGLAGQRNGVVGSFSAITPSVKDGQNQRTLIGSHEENTSISNMIFFSRINRGEGRLLCWMAQRQGSTQAIARERRPTGLVAGFSLISMSYPR